MDNQPVDINAFMGEPLDELVARHRQGATFLFGNYNRVGDLPHGRLATNKSGLEVVISNGNMEYSAMVPMGLAAAILNRTDPLAQAVGAIASREMQRGGATAQEKVAQALASHLPTDADQTPIIFLYAGVSGLSRVLDSVRELRQRYPKAEIYLVGCDCDRSSRFPAILAVVSAQHAIITPECGGRNTMEDIVAALIDRWPKQPLN